MVMGRESAVLACPTSVLVFRNCKRLTCLRTQFCFETFKPYIPVFLAFVLCA